jgi:hypothetical protein
MSNISTHFEMLMPREEQERIGATPDKGDSMRVMRALSGYADLQRENARLLTWIEKTGEEHDFCTFDAHPDKLCQQCNCHRKPKPSHYPKDEAGFYL